VVVVEPVLSGALEALPAGLADLFSSLVVFVVGGGPVPVISAR
jgi:hypothetical protein